MSEIDTTDLGLLSSEDQLRQSFELMFSVAIANFISFPATIYLWKRHFGYVSDEDESFWVTSTFATTFWWGIFLFIFLIDNSKVTLIWFPYFLTLLITLPVSVKVFY